MLHKSKGTCLAAYVMRCLVSQNLQGTPRGACDLQQYPLYDKKRLWPHLR